MNGLATWAPLPLGNHVLAESPRWDGRTNELVWVDVFEGSLCRSTFADETQTWTAAQRWSVGVPATSVSPLHDPRLGWALATGRHLARVSRQGVATAVCELVASADYPALRTNDMVTDVVGRLYVGLLEEVRSNPRAALLRVDLDGSVSVAVDGLIAANGLGFSPDASTLYLVDSIPKTLTAYPYENGSGHVGAGDVMVRWVGPGTLDGLMVDDTGDIWVAVWDAGVVCRYTPGGDLVDTYASPVVRPTALALVGSCRNTVVLTTARVDLRSPVEPQKPTSEGQLFAMRVPT